MVQHVSSAHHLIASSYIAGINEPQYTTSTFILCIHAGILQMFANH